MAVLFGFARLFGNPMLLLIALFVWIVMRSGFVTLQAEQSLDEALTEVRTEGGLTLAVTEDGRFVGLLTPENVGEFFMNRRALRTVRHRCPACLPRVAWHR